MAEKIKALYEDRPYHNWGHIERMLEFCKDHMTTALELAIMYHDCIYIPGDPLNEEKSCLKMRELEPVCPEEGKQMVESLIMVTKRHIIFPWHPFYEDASWIIDADLWGFIEDPVGNATKVRQEFSHVSDADWRKGRKEFLAKFAMRRPFFYAGRNEERYGATARNNCMEELRAL